MQLDGAAIRLLGAGQDLEQRRFPGPIRPDQPDSLAGSQLKTSPHPAPAPARNA